MKTALTIAENKIPDISNLATKTALTTVGNKIPDISRIVKKQFITLKYQVLMLKLIKSILIRKKSIRSLFFFYFL